MRGRGGGVRGRGGGVRGSAGRAGPGCGRLGVAHTEVTGFHMPGRAAVAERRAVPAAATDQGLRESLRTGRLLYLWFDL